MTSAAALRSRPTVRSEREALLNDVVVTGTGAYFTDSFNPVLYRIPIGSRGTLGQGSTITLTGPAATIVPGAPNLNGIEATPDGSTLLVNHTALGQLFTVDPRRAKARRSTWTV